MTAPARRADVAALDRLTTALLEGADRLERDLRAVEATLRPTTRRTT